MAGTQRADVFVGRGGELSLLTERMRRAAEGRPQVALMEGEAGVGKTALLARALADGPEMTALWATTDEAERELPFGVIDQLIRAWPSGTSTEFQINGADPLAVGSTFLELITSGLQERPVAIVVDDLPWADLPSVQALLFALRRLRVDPVVAFFTARTEDAERIPHGLHQLLASEGGVRLDLHGLSRDDLFQLARDIGSGELPASFLNRLLRHTRGNPLHARALLEELPPEVWAAEGPLPAPRTFAAIVLARLAEVGGDAQRLVAAAAVLGQQGRVADAAIVAGLGDPTIALDETIESDLLAMAESWVAPSFSFKHPLVQAAVYHHLAPGRRSELHHRASTVAVTEWGRLRHLAAATLGEDPELSAEIGALAAREIASHPARAEIAAAAFKAAARLAPERARREDLLLRALECLLLAGDAGQAALLAELLPEFEDSARLLYVRGWLALVEGRWEEADAELQAAWEATVRDDDPGLAAAIAAHFATLYVNWADRLPEAAKWASRSLIEDDSQSPAAVGPAGVLPVSLAACGRYEDALEAVSSIPEGRELGAADINALTGRGIVRLWMGDLNLAQTDLAQAVAAAKRFGLFATGVIAMFYLSETEFRIGAWDDAIVHGELAASIATDADQTWMLTHTHSNAALPLAWRGHWEAAEAHIEKALTAVDPQDANIVWAQTSHAALAAARGNYREVVEATDEVETALRGVIEPGIKPWWALRAEALVALGEPDRAVRALAPFEQRAKELGSTSALLACARIRGTAASARGEHEIAERDFGKGLDHLVPCPDPFERARFQLAFGSYLRRRGRRRQALKSLKASERIFARLAARPLLDETHQELRACGQTPRRRTEDARLELTPQEHAVAHLVSQGLRNREIAAKLVVSAKTIEYHLGNAYRKVGVSNRVELANRLAALNK